MGYRESYSYCQQEKYTELTSPVPLPSHNTIQHPLAWSQPWFADWDADSSNVLNVTAVKKEKKKE